MKLNPHENTDNFMTASIFFVYPRIDPTLVYKISCRNVYFMVLFMVIESVCGFYSVFYQTITETSRPINKSLLSLRRLLEHPLNVDKSTLPEVSY